MKWSVVGFMVLLMLSLPVMGCLEAEESNDNGQGVELSDSDCQKYCAKLSECSLLSGEPAAKRLTQGQAALTCDTLCQVYTCGAGFSELGADQDTCLTACNAATVDVFIYSWPKDVLDCFTMYPGDCNQLPTCLSTYWTEVALTDGDGEGTGIDAVACETYVCNGQKVTRAAKDILDCVASAQCESITTQCSLPETPWELERYTEEADGDGSETSDDPFASYDCSGAGSDVCSNAVCQIKSGYDSLNAACATSGAPAYCASIAQCVQNYLSCFENACPDVNSVDAMALASCSTDWAGCIGL